MSDSTNLEWILGQLPEMARPEAERLVGEATQAGWTDIGFWTYDDEPGLSNLVGVHPHTWQCSHINAQSVEKSKQPASAEEIASREELLRALKLL